MVSDRRPVRRVAVIGAGASGLVTARELLHVGILPTVFEASSALGGTWCYGAAHSAMYDSLRTNLPTRLMAFRDLPFEPSEQDARSDGLWFCSHREVRRYLEDVADRFNLRRLIRFETRVNEITTDADGINIDADDAPFDAVAICSGHYVRPRIPDLPGTFSGTISHSFTYRTAEPFAGKRVALLGARSSGVDLSREIATVAEHVYLSARDFNQRQTVGNITEVPTITALGQELTLADGSTLDVDHLIYCTGYDYDLSLVPDGLLDQQTGSWVGPLYRDLIVPAAPRIAIIGLPFAIVPFPLFEAQARYWAHSLTGRVALPADMRALTEAHLEQLQKDGIPTRHFLKYGERQFAYVDDLLERTGSLSLPSWYAPLYRQTRAAKQNDPEGYRDAAW